MDPARSSAVAPGTWLPLVVPAHAPGAQLVAFRDDRLLAVDVAGAVDDTGGPPVSGATRFDLASITKLVTAIAVLALVDARAVGLDTSVTAILPRFGGSSSWARKIRVRHLLSHTSGLPATVILTDTRDPTAARSRALAVGPDRQPGTTLRYSDTGFIVLGLALEALTGQPLEMVLEELVLGPAGMASTGFCPDAGVAVAATELCAWRGRRLRGEAHDENAAALGGVAGHAGLFAPASDVAGLGRVLAHGGAPLLREETVARMRAEEARDDGMRRGLGVALWSPDPEATSNPLGHHSFGHTGFTGTSLWIDPDRELTIALLANPIYRGRDDASFSAARIEIHRGLAALADRMG